LDFDLHARWPAPPKRVWQLVIAVSVLLVFGFMTWGLTHLLFSPSGPKVTYTYQVTGTGPAFDVSYDNISGSKDLSEVALPFSITVREYKGHYFVMGQLTRPGTITCTVTSSKGVVVTKTVVVKSPVGAGGIADCAS
jgi:hypothetical protein